MPDTPLNPDALEAAARATYEMRNPESWARTWDELEPKEREKEWVKPTRTSTLAYLAVAQPEVNTVEELDQLPGGSIVKSGGREFYKTSYVELPWILPYGVDRFGSSYLAKHSKVIVIHRPEVKP